jgi:carboxyl-terminal processing protease
MEARMNDHKTLKIVIAIVVGLMLVTGAFTGGLLVGWLLPEKSSVETAISTTQVEQPQTAATTTPEDLQALFKPFWEAWNLVHEQYVDQPVDDTKMMEGAISGMMDSLGDEHSGYMDPQTYEEATRPLDESYEGIGAYVDVTGDYLTIISPMPGSPAEGAGLKPGDKIIQIDGKDMTGIDPSVALQSVLGASGTEVTLTIRRDDTSETFDVTITRAKIDLPSVSSKMLDNNIAYIAISTFGENTNNLLEKALKDLLAQNPKGLILDLRYNTGGYLTTAIEVISQFIPSGVVMYEQEGDGTETSYEALPGGLATQIPLVVLVNEGSASASEITAGALQDYGRAPLVGTTTYGKGSVQNWIPLSNDQGAVRITIARWLTPNHRQINKIGLTPDYVVEITDEEAAAGKDPQLDKAIELILQGQ